MTNINCDSYYLKQKEPQQGCLIALRKFILKFDEITESIKWHIPCFSYRNKHFCFLNIEKQTGDVYILFVDGHHLNHPLLEQGDRKQMKILRQIPEKDINIEALNIILKAALQIRNQKR